jgi:uncharacterized protein YaeQ
VAHASLLYNFDIELSDVDRHVYETLALRVACHASETGEHLVARVLAYCLEFTEGLSFGPGLAEPDQPPLAVRDLTGALLAWIDVGAPDAARLHKAAKAAPRVAVYTHKDPAVLVRQCAGERIHRAQAIRLHGIDRALVAGLAARLQRRTAFSLSVNEQQLYVTIGDVTLSGAVELHALGAG